MAFKKTEKKGENSLKRKRPKDSVETDENATKKKPNVAQLVEFDIFAAKITCESTQTTETRNKQCKNGYEI